MWDKLAWQSKERQSERGDPMDPRRRAPEVGWMLVARCTAPL